MASSSAYHQQKIEHLAISGIEPDTKRKKVSESSRLFDVFINHRGPDVYETLTAHIYNSLQELGLRTFLDCKDKELGDYFPSTVETVIRSAPVHIAIFSERYAQSAWCLAELVLMLESRSKIFPLFYGVRSWELRYIENGAYADAFTNYKEKGRYLQKLESWKKALKSASLITGSEINSAESFCNSEEFEILSVKVQKEVERAKPLSVAKYPVGLQKLVRDFERQCLHKLVDDFENQCGLSTKGNDHSKIIGIYGMGGVGKTTLAKELFNRKRSEYSRSCFLFDVREESCRSRLPSLQVKLLRDLFNETPPEFQRREKGSNYIRDRLGRSRVLSFLIVADDVDHVKQLDTLCFMDIANKSHNSLVIVTTRDVGVLKSAGITNQYYLKGLDREDGRKLFCWHSFGQPSPACVYEKLVDAFIDVCGGLPLSLQVLGRHVYGRPVCYWELQLCKVRASLDRDIKDILKISYDALHTVEKQIFMDIACFFADKFKNTATRVWEASGWGAGYALETLKDRCLVEEVEKFDGLPSEERPAMLKMHDHLRDLGREMAKELNSPPRHWSLKHCKSLETKGFKNILAQAKGRCFQSIFDKSMGSQITYFMGESEECAETSSSLLWLQLDLNRKELSSIPAWIPLQNLQCLRIRHGRLNRLWQSNVQVPSKLKELQIYQTTLNEFPDFSGISNNLEQVMLDAKDMPLESWYLLESLRVYPRSLVLTSSTLRGELDCNNRGDETTFKSSYFTSLAIQNFVKQSDEGALNNIGESKAFKRPLSKCPLSNLENLEINNQVDVTKISICGSYCPSLLSLKIHDMECLIELNLLEVKTLNCLEIKTCRSLKRLSETSNFRNLVSFNFSQCPELEELSVAHLTSLEKITIKNCEQLRVSGLSNLRKLVKLDIFHCSVLELCFMDASCLKEICVGGCGELKHLELKGCKKLKIVGMFNLEKLLTLNISDCSELQELVIPEGPNCLESIIIDSCQDLGKVSGGKFNAAKFFILDCPELEELQCFAGLTYVEQISISRCGKLQDIILPTTLDRLHLNACRMLKSVSGISKFRNLAELNISECWELKLELELCLEAMNSLEKFTIDECPKLNYLGLYRCQLLKRVSGNFDPAILHIMECPELEELPCFTPLTWLEYICIFSCRKLQNMHVEDCQKLEKIDIKYCEKLRNITLPTTLISLSVKGCKELQSMEGIENLTKLRGMNISECPELEELPSLARPKCVQWITIDTCAKLQRIHVEDCEKLEEIDIKYCDKMKNISLPTTLNNISVTGCRELQSVTGTGDLTKLRRMNISECPELEELPSLKCVRRIQIDSCEKLQILHVEDCEKLQILHVEDCEKLQILNVENCEKLESIMIKHCEKMKSITLPTDGISNLAKVTWVNIGECPQLEELPSLARLGCLENIEIHSCDKLRNITLPTTLISLSIQSCRDLHRVVGSGDLTKLTNLYIGGCPQLEELPNVSRLIRLKEIEIYSCVKLQHITLPTILISLSIRSCRDLQRVVGSSDLAKLTNLYISGCPELEELPSVSRLTCIEEIEIDSCEKLQNITLPTTLISLSAQSCRHLQRVAGIGDLMELKELTIIECPELEELPSLFRVSCMEKIEIKHCMKLQSITLPTTLIRLSVYSCRRLVRVVAYGELIKLTELIISECPDLEELPSLGRVSCLKYFMIDSCEKLQNIASIEDLRVSAFMRLCYCSNAVIRNCVHKLKSVPTFTCVIGRAVDGSKPSLYEYLFSNTNTGVDQAIKTSTHETDPLWSVLHAVIECFVVVVNSSTSVEAINESLPSYGAGGINESLPSYGYDFMVREGEWIITMVTSDYWRHRYYMEVKDVLRRNGILQKSFRLELRKGEEWKGLDMLRKIVDRLHY